MISIDRVPWSHETARALGARIRKERERQGMSQEQLGEAAGVTKNQVQLIEAGRSGNMESGSPSNPRTSTLFGIADALDVCASFLIDGL